MYTLKDTNGTEVRYLSLVGVEIQNLFMVGVLMYNPQIQGDYVRCLSADIDIPMYCCNKMYSLNSTQVQLTHEESVKFLQILGL